MDPIIRIDQPVDVIVSFTIKGNAVSARPLRMRYRGRDITFTGFGLCHPVRHGSQLHYVFNVSDNANDYSLDFDTVTLTWTLTAIIDGSSL